MSTSPKDKERKEKKIKAWIWCYGVDETPMISFRKPMKREIKNGKLFNTEVFPCVITYKLK